MDGNYKKKIDIYAFPFSVLMEMEVLFLYGT